jgi:hypothetical protein
MRDVFRVSHAACVALFAVALGCASNIQHDPPELRDEPMSPASSRSDTNDVASGAAGSGSATPPRSPSGSAGEDSAPLPGHEAGTGVSTPIPGVAGSGAGNDETGTGMAGSGSVDPGDCVDATRLWFEDFESGNYQRWTSNTYGGDWGDGCQSTALSAETAVSPGNSERSEVTCAYAADTVHRGYGGLQFAGDQRAPAYTNQGVGIDAPDGVVNTMWVRLDSPTVFEGGKWLSLWTVNGSCDWEAPDDVLTLGLEDASGRLAAAHYQSGGGARTFEPGAPGMPRGEWVRITVYVNFHSGEMHVWQNGQSIEHVTFTRPVQTICHWHWGLYASSNNDDIVLFEDDNSIWKLHEPWDDFSVEPYFDGSVTTCD